MSNMKRRLFVPNLTKRSKPKTEKPPVRGTKPAESELVLQDEYVATLFVQM
jgi:hypothetical protein